MSSVLYARVQRATDNQRALATPCLANDDPGHTMGTSYTCKRPPEDACLITWALYEMLGSRPRMRKG